VTRSNRLVLLASLISKNLCLKIMNAPGVPSQDSLMSSAPSQYPQVQPRIPVALYYPQSLISPSSSYSNPPNGQLPSSPVLGGAGYGPPVLSTLTPVQKIVKDAIETRREYDLVCLPITNDRYARNVYTGVTKNCSDGRNDGKGCAL
jgi:hypothetical protein